MNLINRGVVVIKPKESFWPAERTGTQFDAWFTLEVHPMVWDTMTAPIVKEKADDNCAVL